MAIDDEPLALRQVKSYIDRIPQVELVAACRNAVEAQAMLPQRDVDLLLVDINMPDLNGMDFVRQLHNPPLVIFTTAYSEYAIEGFRLDAVDYLLKPFSFADFNRAIGKAGSLLELMRLRDRKTPEAATASATEDNAGDCISVKADYKVSIIKHADIIYLESEGEYVRLHLTSGSTITTLFRLKNMETTLPSGRFMRVHRSYIVNLAHVSGYARGRVYLDNGEYVPLGENYRDAFREYIERRHPAAQIRDGIFRRGHENALSTYHTSGDSSPSGTRGVRSGKADMGAYPSAVRSKQKWVIPFVRITYRAPRTALYRVACSNTSEVIRTSGALHSTSATGRAALSITTTSARWGAALTLTAYSSTIERSGAPHLPTRNSTTCRRTHSSGVSTT